MHHHHLDTHVQAMTSPIPASGRLSVSGADPPRRTFGGGSSLQRPSSSQGLAATSPSASSSVSVTPTSSVTNLNLPYKPNTNRTRSSSSVSSDKFTNAADKASAWLSNWAPKGEGRSREFFAQTLNGVANVASTVSSGINERVNNLGATLSNESFGNPNRRSTSYTAPGSFESSPPDVGRLSISPSFGMPPPPVPLSKSPPVPTHTSSTPALAGPQLARKIPQPANLARLGAEPRPAFSSPPTSTAVPSIPRSTSASLAPGPHGPSHLNPSHNRSVSSQSTHLRNGSFSHSQALSRSSSTTAGGTGLRSAGMPYKIGFQPAGVKSDRTPEFVEERRKWSEEREKEEGRLGRRWAKLVDLHFNPTPPPPPIPRSASSSFSLAGMADKRRSLLSMDSLDSLKPNSMWKGIKGIAQTPEQSMESRKRAAEQALVKWEDDGEAKKCRICQSSFNLSTKRHHCRTCGRIVCSLPPTPSTLLAVQQQVFGPSDSGALPPGTRLEKCSRLLVADWKTGRAEEVEEGFVGWMKIEDEESPKKSAKRERRKSKASANGDEERDVPLPQQPKEVQVRGIRVCKDCWATISRKQKQQDLGRIGIFAKLYNMLRGLQGEIEEVMPDFEEQMDILTTESLPPTPEMLSTHKNLLALLAQYEHLSKRMAELPCPDPSSQAALQASVARVAATFLATQMAKVQALPKLQKAMARKKRVGIGVRESTLAETMADEEGEDLAVVLQPLLEQEAQLEAMIADARDQRKYEDGKALAEALADIRKEISRVASGGV